MKLGWTVKGTLGGIGGIVTLRDGGGILRTEACGGRTMGGAGSTMVLSNILSRSTMDCCWASPNWANNAAGAGLVRASVRARAVTMAASTEDVFGTRHWCRKSYTVLEVRSGLVFVT